MKHFTAFVAPLAAALLSACSFGSSPAVPPAQINALLPVRSATGAGKIEHIVFVVQEDRSFDNLFQGYPGADTVSSGKISTGRTIKLRPVSLATTWDIEHGLEGMFTDCNGTGKLPGTKCAMDGFDKSYWGCGASGPRCPIKYPPYAYVPHDQSRPYFEMAHEWVVADKMFASQLDGEFVGHQYTIAAQAGRSVGAPNSFDDGCSGHSEIQTLTDERTYGPYEPACFDYETLGGELDKTKLSWRYYLPTSYGSSPYGYIRGFDKRDSDKHIVSPPTRFLSDLAAGKLASFSWVTPTLANSDHSGSGSDTGPSWVSAVVNAVGESKFWDSTAIFVEWENWGGLYDHVPPQYMNFDGLGFRVPLLVISPYAKQNYVSHRHYETASVLRFAEDVYGLKRLSAADRRAKSPAADCFDFSQKPRKFVPIKAPKGENFFLHQEGE